MILRKILFCGAACGLAFLASCTPDPDAENEIAQQVADGTLPPWLAETSGESAYTPVGEGSSATYKPQRQTSSSKSGYKAPSKSSSSKSVAKKSSGKSSTAKTPSSRGKTSSSKSKKTTYYVVKKGDAVEKIARKYKVSSSALMKTNGLKSDLIRPGQKLRIP